MRSSGEIKQKAVSSSLLYVS